MLVGFLRTRQTCAGGRIRWRILLTSANPSSSSSLSFFLCALCCFSRAISPPSPPCFYFYSVSSPPLSVSTAERSVKSRTIWPQTRCCTHCNGPFGSPPAGLIESRSDKCFRFPSSVHLCWAVANKDITAGSTTTHQRCKPVLLPPHYLSLNRK